MPPRRRKGGKGESDHHSVSEQHNQGDNNAHIARAKQQIAESIVCRAFEAKQGEDRRVELAALAREEAESRRAELAALAREEAETRRAELAAIEQLHRLDHDTQQKEAQLRALTQLTQGQEARRAELDHATQQKEAQLRELTQLTQWQEAHLVELKQLTQHEEAHLMNLSQLMKYQETRLRDLEQDTQRQPPHDTTVTSDVKVLIDAMACEDHARAQQDQAAIVKSHTRHSGELTSALQSLSNVDAKTLYKCLRRFSPAIAAMTRTRKKFMNMLTTEDAALRQEILETCFVPAITFPPDFNYNKNHLTSCFLKLHYIPTAVLLLHARKTKHIEEEEYISAMHAATSQSWLSTWINNHDVSVLAQLQGLITSVADMVQQSTP